MKGMIGCGLGVVHVLLAQMAAGGGMLLCYFEWLRRHGRSMYAGRFITGSFQRVVAVAFVVGALTGLAMWFVSIQLAPGRIGDLVRDSHWIWMTEWTFFCVEVVAGFAYLRYHDRLSGKDRLTMLGIYSLATAFSLFWKSAILSPQLDPGRLMPMHRLGSIFINPSFWPSFLSRCLTAMAIAGLGACIVTKISVHEDREARRDLIGHGLRFLAPMVLLPLLSIWFLARLPADGTSAAPEGIPSTMICTGVTAVASLLIGAWGLSAFWFGKLETSWLAIGFLCLSALLATAGSELVCERVRRPDSLRHAWFSQSLQLNGQTKDRP
jgi:hypothetical protein